MRKKSPKPKSDEAVQPVEHPAAGSEAEILEYWNAEKQREAIPLPLPEVESADGTKRTKDAKDA